MSWTSLSAGDLELQSLDALDSPAPVFDATTYLTFLLVTLFGITASQVFGPLGAIGQPALLVAAGGGLIWLWTRVTLARGVVHPGPQPLKWALFVYAWYELATIALAHTRSLSALEQSGSVRTVFLTLAMVGLSLLVMDGIPSLDRLDVLLRRLTLAVGFLAMIGILQFLTGQSLEIDFPLLSFNNGVTQVGQRYAFNRPDGTAGHPIEFGVVLAAMLPLAVHYALEWRGGTRRQRRVSSAAALVVAFGVPLSISRSAIVAVVASLSVMWLGWGWRRRSKGLVVLALWLPMIYLTVPGLLGTFRGLFTSFGHDPSITARVDRMPIVFQLIKENPWFGMGAGTVTPEDDLLLDNQVWGTILATGIVGFLILLGLIVLTMVMAITSQHHRGATKETRLLGFAIAAAIFGYAMSFATFDAMYFRILKTTFFLLIGATGALWRLTRDAPPGAIETPPPRGSPDRATASRPGPGATVR